LEAVSKSDSLAAPLTLLLEGKLDLDTDRHAVLGKVIDAATDRDDLQALSLILMNADLKRVSTLARKAIQEIDYAYYGPQIES